MAKYYNVGIASKYEAKVKNDASEKCSLDEQSYEAYLNEIKVATKTIVTNLDNLTKSMQKLEKDSQTGAAVAKYCASIRTNTKKVKDELNTNRTNLSKQLDAEFRRQIKQWIAWAKAQAAAENKKI